MGTNASACVEICGIIAQVFDLEGGVRADEVVVAEGSEVGGGVGLDHDIDFGGVDGEDGGVEGEGGAEEGVVADEGEAGRDCWIGIGFGDGEVVAAVGDVAGEGSDRCNFAYIIRCITCLEVSPGSATVASECQQDENQVGYCFHQ